MEETLRQVDADAVAFACAAQACRDGRRGWAVNVENPYGFHRKSVHGWCGNI